MVVLIVISVAAISSAVVNGVFNIFVNYYDVMVTIVDRISSVVVIVVVAHVIADSFAIIIVVVVFDVVVALFVVFIDLSIFLIP